MKNLVCIGDSLVEGEGDVLGLGGWVGRLHQKLKPANHPKYVPDYHDWGEIERNVYNLGIGGDTIRDVDLRMGEAMARRPDVMIIGCCTNDVVLYEGKHPKMTEYHRQRFWPIVLRNAKGMCDKVLVTPGLFVERDFFDENGHGLSKSDFWGHVAFIEKTAKAAGCEFLSVPESFARDEWRSHDLHWNAVGYDHVADLIYDKLNALKWI